jgi:OmpA-OmpF porin, OOP family
MTCRSAAGLLVVALAVLTPRARGQDVTGGKDHPLISRYEGSTIVKYGQKAFAEYTLARGPQVFHGDARGHGKISLAGSERVAGKLTRITYLAPAGRSALEIYRNYEEALSSAGFELLFRCMESECGARFASAAFPLRQQELPGSVGTIGIQDQHYLAARLERPQGDLYVGVYVYFDKSNFVPPSGSREVQRAMLTQLDLVEVTPMEGGKVQVDAAAMARELARTGHVALYEIYFDTDKAIVKPESDPTLAEIAKFLEDSPGMKIFVVGHTDDTGGFDHNTDLSRRRAAAVVEALVRKHAVDAKRLQAHGVGRLAPVASNDSEQGRARNRRVELVKW